jgi:hypothetical protein
MVGLNLDPGGVYYGIYATTSRFPFPNQFLEGSGVGTRQRNWDFLPDGPPFIFNGLVVGSSLPHNSFDYNGNLLPNPPEFPAPLPIPRPAPPEMFGTYRRLDDFVRTGAAPNPEIPQCAMLNSDFVERFLKPAMGGEGAGPPRLEVNIAIEGSDEEIRITHLDNLIGR